MAPHDLLCKWCSTFVGKGKKFCSIFCESRYTRSKRRQLPFKRPVHSSTYPSDREYESPRSSKTAPVRKDAFLEDVITAIGNEKPSPERDKRTDEDTSANSNRSDSNKNSSRKDSDRSVVRVPKLDLTSPKDQKEARDLGDTKSNKKISAENGALSEQISNRSDTKEKLHNKKEKSDIKARSKPEKQKSNSQANPPRMAKEPSDIKAKIRINSAIKSKTQTLIVHKRNGSSKIPIQSKTMLNKSVDEVMTTHKSLTKTTTETADVQLAEVKNNKLTSLNGRIKSGNIREDTDQGLIIDPKVRPISKAAQQYSEKVRSSGYGNPVNPRLRPLALKPRSATLAGSASKKSRQTSAKSTKSSVDLVLAAVRNEDNRPIDSKKEGKWELTPDTINEVPKTAQRKESNRDLNKSLEDEDPTPKTSPKRNGTTSTSRVANTTRFTNRSELTKISEIHREESANSIVDHGELQSRLSTIKRKVETVRKRRLESRSSIGSDLDTSFQDSSQDLSTDRDALNLSQGTSQTGSLMKQSARSNITRISKQFQTSASTS